MKNLYWIIISVLLLSFLLMPLLAVERKGEPQGKKHGTSSVVMEQGEKLPPLTSIRVYLTEEKKTVEVSIEEYLLGVVACEMSADAHSEALKAQAVAAYTYAYRKHLQNAAAEYDITTDSSLDQGYLSEAKRSEKWGDQTASKTERVRQAVSAVKNQVIVYKGEPILAAYHAISPGNTETAANVWGTDYPYLQSESSVSDLLAPDYLSEVRKTPEEFKTAMTTLGITPTGEVAAYIGASEKSVAGTVLHITLCGKELTGAAVRDAFSLRSAAFDLKYEDGAFVFSVMGYGHGVGMSQFGADYMAKQGSDYKEILAAYYRDTEVIALPQ